jgi:hypothetical protein
VIQLSAAYITQLTSKSSAATESDIGAHWFFAALYARLTATKSSMSAFGAIVWLTKSKITMKLALTLLTHTRSTVVVSVPPEI